MMIMKRKFFAMIMLLLLTMTVGARQNYETQDGDKELAGSDTLLLPGDNGQTERPDTIWMQDYKLNGKLTKKQRKQLKAMMDSINFARAAAAMDNMDFVLRADRLLFKYGHTAYVNSVTNFISVSGDYATVQVAPFYGGGPNGVGGITLDGRVSNVKYETRKNGNWSLSMSVMGSIISATLNIELYAGGNNAEVTITSNFRSNKITLTGTLTPPDDTYIYKGTSY
jgi:hypothetical protein